MVVIVYLLLLESLTGGLRNTGQFIVVVIIILHCCSCQEPLNFSIVVVVVTAEVIDVDARRGVAVEQFPIHVVLQDNAG